MAIPSPSNLFSVWGMVVVITGGGSGIGLMITKAFALNGAAKVYIIGRRKEKLEEAAKLSSNIIPVVGDVTSTESIRQAAEQIKRESGFINLLCCNSGYKEPALYASTLNLSAQEFAKEALELNPEDWVNAFKVNTISVAFNIFAFLNLLDAGNMEGNCAPRQSQVIVTGSVGGFLRIPECIGAYAPSKAATAHLVKSMAGLLTPYSIRVNAIAPGLFPSDLSTDVISHFGLAGLDPQAENVLPKAFVPAGRLGRTEDIVGAMLYMASAAGAYMNGNISVIDGGQMSQLNATY